jgi:3'-phosphoadenosine 5'-phosphosulfate sulfotransferase (PAPS reductase)/FAD synthetase
MSRILVQLSGGKDSFVVLHLALANRAADDDIAAIYNDMGDSFVHVLKHIEEICSEWDVPLIISRPIRGVKDSFIVDGYPSDIVPMWASSERDIFQRISNEMPHRIVSGLSCCTKHLFQPLYNATVAYKPDIVMRGSKGTDEHVTSGPTFTHLDIMYHCPIWDWTDEQVFDYVEENNIKLPVQYDCGVVHSLDCMGCTAWLEGESEPDRVRFTREYYPQDYERLKSNMLAVDNTINQALKYTAAFRSAFYNKYGVKQ